MGPRSRLRLAAALLAAALAAGAAPAPSRHVCLWRVRGRTNTVFLLGSIHMLGENAYPLDPRIRSAFSRAREVVFEIDFDRGLGAAGELLARTRLPAGQSLDTVLPPDLRRSLDAELRRLGLDPAEYDTVKPWLVAATLGDLELERAGYDPARGIDMVLYRRARRAGKQVRALEAARRQIAFLDGLSPALQADLLRQTLAEMKTLVPEAARLTAMWRNGDAAGLARLLRETFRGSPELYRRLVLDRNRAWLPRIAAMTTADHDILVVVGALHLVGGDGLVAGLRARGLTVTQE